LTIFKIISQTSPGTHGTFLNTKNAHAITDVSLLRIGPK